MITTGNQVTGTTLTPGGLNVYIENYAIRQFEKWNRFYKALPKKSLPEGQHAYVMNIASRTVTTIAQSTLVEGTTPNETAYSMTQVAVICTQYGSYAKISDIGEKDSVVNMYEETAFELSRNLAEIADKVIQNELLTNGTYAFYSGAVASRALLTTTSYMKNSDLAAARALLSAKAAPGMDGTNYYGVFHSFIVYDLRTDTTTNGGWFDAVKYSMPEKILDGEVGQMHNIRILETQTISAFLGGVGGTVNIFPSYLFGKDAFQVVESQPFQTIIKGSTEGGAENPLNLYGSVGVKLRFGVKIKKQEALLRIESAASLAINYLSTLPY